MSACEKCWRDAHGQAMGYERLLRERTNSPCTPEQQAGPDAGKCLKCGRKTLHQHTGQPMCGCPDEHGISTLSRTRRVQQQRKARRMMGEVHCWQSYRGWVEKTYGESSPEWMDHIVNGIDQTCMLPDGHDGPHEWTPDTEIVVTCKATT